MIKTRARNFGALVVGLALVAGACGGSDDAAEEPAEEPQQGQANQHKGDDDAMGVTIYDLSKGSMRR